MHGNRVMTRPEVVATCSRFLGVVSTVVWKALTRIIIPFANFKLCQSEIWARQLWNTS